VETSARPAAERGFSPAILVAAVLLMVLGGAAFWYYQWQSAHPAQPAALTAEGKAYTRNLGLSEVEMKAAEAFSGHEVVEIVGKVQNNGDRPVAVVEVMCVFYDPYGQVLSRERVSIVRKRSGGLKPGEKKAFRLPFDNVPAGWNQTLPSLVIANIEFQ
jgi:hypothetical protein